MSNRAFTLQNLTDFSHNLGVWLVAHTDQAQAVLTSVEAAAAAMAAGSISAAIAALQPVFQIVESDILAFQQPVTAHHLAALQSPALGRNGAIIAQIIAAIQAGGGLANILSKLLPVIQQIMTMFPTKP